MLCWRRRWPRLSGTAFGSYGEGYLRFSIANSIENLQEALKRVDAWTKNNLYSLFPLIREARMSGDPSVVPNSRLKNSDKAFGCVHPLR